MALDDLISRVKETPISHIIGRYIQVSKKGTQQVALCPFHNDTNPSMNVNDHKNMWFCFVDQIGGDAIKFVQLRQNLEFVDALRDICEHMGWNWEDFVQEKKQAPKFEMGRKILSKTTQLYRKLAQTGQFPAHPEFIKKRNISEELATTYALGYAPSNNALSDYLHSIKDEKERDFALKTAEELGLIRPDKYNQKAHYDTFRDRIMFPIWDQFGHVIGFTSRATRDDQKAKYMNSVDSFLFNKKNLLYGLHLAKSTIRSKDAVILVEGNMDQVALYGNGFQNTVAIMGTALGEPSLQRILNLTQNVYLALDNDMAGIKAAERTNVQFMEAGVLPRFVDLSPHKDPDEFIESEGSVAFQKRLDEARTFLDYQIDSLFPEQIPELADRQLDILREFYSVVAPLGTSLAAKERLAVLAKRLGLQSDPASIIEDYQEFLKKNEPMTPSRTKLVKEAQNAEDSPVAYEKSEVIPLKMELTRVERTLLQEVVQHPELLLRKEVAELLDFTLHDEVKRYVLRLRELMYEIDESEYEKVLSNLLGNNEYSLELTTVASAALFKYRPSTLNEKVMVKMISDIKRKLQEDKLKVKKDELKKQQKASKTQDEQNKVLTELAKIDKELIRLKTAGRRPAQNPGE